MIVQDRTTILQSLEMDDVGTREEDRMDSTNHQPSEREVHRVQANREELVELGILPPRPANILAEPPAFTPEGQ